MNKFYNELQILRKNPRTAHFVESAIEKRRGFPEFHNLQLPPGARLGRYENRFIQQNRICEVSNRPPPAVLAATTRTGVFLHHQPPPDPSTCTNSLRLKKKKTSREISKKSEQEKNSKPRKMKRKFSLPTQSLDPSNCPNSTRLMTKKETLIQF